MATLTAPTTPTNLSADDLAAANRAGNLAAMRRMQPSVADVIDRVRVDHKWLYARDGSLTAQDDGGHWITDCSLPRRAAEAMLESLEAKAGTACFLEPTHAAQVRHALARMQPSQAIIAIVTDPTVVHFILGGDDFSSDLAHGRLWFATGELWADAMRAILVEHEGLPTASLFIRLPTLDDGTAQPLIHAARELFASESTRRASRILELKASATTRRRGETPRVCVVTPSTFRLWDDAGWMLRRALVGRGSGRESFQPFDPDRPTDASPVAFARAAADADAVVTANVFRSDVQDVVHAAVSWLTWVTTPRVGMYRADAAADRVLLADESFRPLALAAGWPAERVELAAWPAMDLPPATSDVLVMVTETRPVGPNPPRDFELSSHQLLWELIYCELSRDALSLDRDLHGYLTTRIRKLGIADEGLDRRLFIEELMLPVYEQAVAREILRQGLPLRIYGSGWQGIEEFRRCADGPIQSRPQFLAAVASAKALVHATPLPFAHPIDAAGRPVLRTAGLRAADLARAGRQGLAQRAAPCGTESATLSSERILSLCPKS